MRMLSKSEVKYIQTLRDKKSRVAFGQFIAEGPKIVADLLNEYPAEIVSVYATENWVKKNALLPAEITKEIAGFELEKISMLQTPQEVLAIVKMQSNDFMPFRKNGWSLMLDGIQDPGNMGSIIRCADWFGIAAMYCTNDTADRYNPKVVQSAMGSILRVPVCYGNCEQWLSETRVPVYATMLEGRNIFTEKPLTPGIVIIGNEGKGIRPGLLQHITKAITIPRQGRAESLNAAVATGIVLSHLVNE
jgi:TrmH family RNA methyltransferase